MPGPLRATRSGTCEVPRFRATAQATYSRPARPDRVTTPVPGGPLACHPGLGSIGHGRREDRRASEPAQAGPAQSRPGSDASRRWTSGRSTSTASRGGTTRRGSSRSPRRTTPSPPSRSTRTAAWSSSTGARPRTSTSSTPSSPRAASTRPCAEEANALDDVAFARLIVDPNVPRAEVVRLAAGATPEKLARVVALLRPVELQMAISKMRVRRTPSNQAHVTNRLDDPLLLAADAATAVAYGFREVETTVPVNADAPSNALAVLIGSQVGAGGALTQCSIEEALELELGLQGAHDLRRDREPLRHREGLRRRRRHALVQGVPLLGLRLARAQDAGDERRRRGGADGRRRGPLDVQPRVALRRARPRDGRPGRAERRHRRRQRRRLRARRHARAARREPPRHAPRPRVVLGQRRAGQRVGHAPHRAHRAAVPRRLGLHLQRLRRDPALRQHVRPQQLQRRGPRRLPRAAARLGRGRRAAAGDRGRAARRARAGGARVPGRVPRAGAGGVPGRTHVERGRRGRRLQGRHAAGPAGRPGGVRRDHGAAARDPRRGPRPLGDRATRRRPGACSPWGAPGSPATTCRPRRSSTRSMRCLSKITDPNDYQGPAPATRCRRRAGSRSPRSARSGRAPTCWRGTPPARRGHGGAAAGPRLVERGAARPGVGPPRGVHRRLPRPRHQAVVHDVRAAGRRGAGAAHRRGRGARAARRASCACRPPSTSA